VKRSPELTPLSRQHHTALARALGLRRAEAGDVAEAAAAFQEFFATKGERHFAQEEEVLLPALPAGQEALGRRMLDEHAEIRRRAAALGARPDVTAARELGELVNAHVRFEERELFPRLEAELAPEALAEIGRRLHR
jgi:hemerythrin-like domain-containing protein